MSEPPDPLVRAELASLPSYKAGINPALRAALSAGQPVARLGSNENHWGPSPRVRERMRELAFEPQLYPDNRSSSLSDAIGRGLGISSDRILLAHGSESVLRAVMHAVLRPGDEMVSLAPSFLLSHILGRNAGATRQVVEYDAWLRYPVDDFLSLVRTGPRIVYLANPNNPTGTYWGREALEPLLAALRPQTLIILDEAYDEYARVYEDHVDAQEILESSGRSYVILRTFSKAYGLAGLRIGYGVAHDGEFIDLVRKPNTIFNVSSIAEELALVAWGDPEHLASVAEQTMSEKRDAEAFLDRLIAHGASFRRFETRGNFHCLCFGDLSEALELEARLQEENVFVKALPGCRGDGLLRATVGGPDDNRRFLTALEGQLGG